MRETYKTPPTTLKEFKSSAAQLRGTVCAQQLLLGFFSKRKPLLNMNSHLEFAQRNAGEGNCQTILQLMIPKSSYCAIGQNNVWRNIKRCTSPQMDHLHRQAWAAGPGRRAKVQNIAKSWIIRLSLQANYVFGEDFFSRQDNDPQAESKATQNGSKTTR